MEEKEDQCRTFKELLLEKENEIQELGAMVEENETNKVAESMKQKLVNVLLALGQTVTAEESYDSLLERINVLTLSNGHVTEEEEEGEKTKLLAVTKKLKTEVVSLREKLAAMETKIQENDAKTPDENGVESQVDLIAIKQSLDKVSRERDELVSQNEKLREENHLMLSSHESLKQEHIASLQQLDETQVQLQSQGEELRQLREASDQVQTSQSESSEKLQKVFNENCQLEKNLQEIEMLNQTYATKVDKLQLELDSLNRSIAESKGEKERKEKEHCLDLEKKEEEMSEVQGLLSSSQNEVEKYKTEVSKLLSELEDYKAEKQKSITELSKSSSELDNLNIKLSQVQLELKESMELVQTKHSEVANLQQDIEKKNEQIAGFQINTENLQQSSDIEMLNVSKECDQLREELSKLKENLSMISSERDRVESDLSKSRDEFSNAEKQILQNSDCIESLKTELNQSNALNEQLRSQLNSSLSHDEEYKTLQTQFKDSEQTCQELELQIAKLEQEKVEVNLKNDQLGRDLENLQQELSSVQEKLLNSEGSQNDQQQELASKLQEASKNNIELRSQLDEMSEKHASEVMDLQQKLNSKTTQLELLSEIEMKYQEAEARNEFHSDEIQSLRESSQQLHSDYNALREEYEDLDLKLSRVSSENEVLQSEKEKCESTLVHKQSLLAESQSEIASLKKTLVASSENIKSLEHQKANLEFNSTESLAKVKELTEKEASYEEALNSLKSINEIITNTARDHEKAKLQLETNLSKLTTEAEFLRNCNKEMAVKNVELSSQVDLLMSRKVELETEMVQAGKRIQTLEDDLKNVTKSKEDTVSEEKDVDESEPQIDNNMVHVLNEKIREISQLKSENRTMFQTIAAEKEMKEKLQTEIDESKNTFSAMNSEALKKLSLLIRDKDLEIESLSARNKSLLEIIENEKGTEETSSGNRETALLEEIEKLKTENSKNKDSVDHSNELKYLKNRIEELETKLSCASDSEIINGNHGMERSSSVSETADGSDRSLLLRLETKSVQLESSEKEAASLNQEITELKALFSSKEDELTRTVAEMGGYKQMMSDYQQEVDRVRRSLASVQSLLDEKTTNNASHQEQTLKYIAECERLSKELAQVTQEKEAAVSGIRARSQEAADLRKEVTAIIDKKKRVEGEVERLRAHLVQVEEGYTMELVEAEEREKELRRSLARVEDQLRVVTHTSSEVTQSASQASSQLTAALEAAAGQRDRLSDQLASCQAQLRTRSMELRNLQLALEGFQKQKENELGMVERTAEEKVAREQARAAETEERMRVTRQQLDRAQQGLEAAARLSEQLDKKSTVISNLKQEISVREEMLKSLQAKMLDIANGQVGKVDRDLVKNLVIGYAISDATKKPEILKIIATVLDFNGDERTKTGLDGGTGGWLGGLMGAGGRSRNNSVSQAGIEQNIAKAFIKFLEEESSPKAPVTLPVIEMARSKTEQLAQAHSRPGQTPSPLLTPASPSSLSLPSLASAMASHSPSILKTVLDEEPTRESE